MIRKIRYLLLCSIVFLTACATTKTTYSEEEIDALHNLVASNSFKIVSDQAYPLATASLNKLSNIGLLIPGDNASRISLRNRYNFLSISGDSISAELPYYGEQRLSRTYGSFDKGIALNTLLDEYNAVYNEKENYYELRFNADQDVENYKIRIDIFANNQTYINITSTHRTTIAYRGKVVPSE